MKFLQYARPEHVLFDMKAKTKATAFQEMLDVLVGTGDIDAEKAELILKRLIKREELGSTAPGRRFAYPQIRIREIEKPYLIIGRSEKGVDWDALDGELVNFVALLLVPLSNDDKGSSLFIIDILHTIKRIRDSAAMRFLLQCRTSEELWELLEEIDENNIA